jgi:hypothetical protein
MTLLNDDAIRACMTRHPAGKAMRKPLRLTEKGERWLLTTYKYAVIVAALGTFFLLMGIVGWIEGL